MNYGTFDIEANDWVKFEVMGCFDGQQYFKFESTKAFFNHINQRKYRSWRWYAHNGGRYDFLFLLEHIFRIATRYKLIPRQGRIITVYVETSKTEFTLSDSYALLPDSLAKLSDGFQVQHRKKTFVFGRDKISKTNPKLLAYMENDNICLYEVLKTFFDSEFCVHPKLTIASQALDTWRYRYLNGSTLNRIRCEDDFREKFYSGGRVEVYKGQGRVDYFDVNSLFPYAMLEEMPCGRMFRTKSFQKGCIGFYSVDIKAMPDFYISPLLVKGLHTFKCGEKTVKKTGNYYVRGPGEYFVSAHTLDYMFKEFGIRFKVNYGYYFKRRAPLLADYVNEFYELKRKNKNNALYFIAKYMLNALYGKFGQSRWKESIEEWGTEKLSYPLPGGEDWGLVLVNEESKSEFILPYLAAYITDLARLYHYKLMMKSPESVFYCDTDSILTNDPKAFKSVVGPDIGQLSYVGKFDGVFLAPKNYALKEVKTGVEKIVFKGFQVKKQEGSKARLFRFKDFENSLTDGTALKQTQTRILSFQECIALKEMKRKKRDTKRRIVTDEGTFLKVVEVEKTVGTEYDKRQVTASDRFVFDSIPLSRNQITEKKNASKSTRD